MRILLFVKAEEVNWELFRMYWLTNNIFVIPSIEFTKTWILYRNTIIISNYD